MFHRINFWIWWVVLLSCDLVLGFTLQALLEMYWRCVGDVLEMCWRCEGDVLFVLLFSCVLVLGVYWNLGLTLQVLLEMLLLQEELLQGIDPRRSLCQRQSLWWRRWFNLSTDVSATINNIRYQANVSDNHCDGDCDGVCGGLPL